MLVYDLKFNKTKEKNPLRVYLIYYWHLSYRADEVFYSVFV